MTDLQKMKLKKLGKESDIMITLTDNENLLIHKNNISDAIINTFNIDRSKLVIEDAEKPSYSNFIPKYISKYVYIWFLKDGEKYHVCDFTEYEDRIVIEMDKYLNRRNLFSVKLNRKSGKAIANYIREKTGTNKEIYIFREIPNSILVRLVYLLKVKPDKPKITTYLDEDDDYDLDEEDYFDDDD